MAIRSIVSKTSIVAMGAAAAGCLGVLQVCQPSTNVPTGPLPIIQSADGLKHRMFAAPAGLAASLKRADRGLAEWAERDRARREREERERRERERREREEAARREEERKERELMEKVRAASLAPMRAVTDRLTQAQLANHQDVQRQLAASTEAIANALQEAAERQRESEARIRATAAASQAADETDQANRERVLQSCVAVQQEMRRGNAEMRRTAAADRAAAAQRAAQQDQQYRQDRDSQLARLRQLGEEKKESVAEKVRSAKLALQQEEETLNALRKRVAFLQIGFGGNRGGDDAAASLNLAPHRGQHQAPAVPAAAPVAPPAAAEHGAWAQVDVEEIDE